MLIFACVQRRQNRKSGHQSDSWNPLTHTNRMVFAGCGINFQGTNPGQYLSFGNLNMRKILELLDVRVLEKIKTFEVIKKYS